MIIILILIIIGLLQCSPISAYGQTQIACDKTFTVSGGTSLRIYNCYPYCTGDTMLYLYDANGIQIAYDDDGCGTCSSITYTIPSYVSLQTYTVKMSCYSTTGSCSGTIQIEITGDISKYEYLLYI